ncbi:MAG TPA: ABC transporter ATP-binding protein, partial [Candidatus Fermentibacter sp.]|nr:ABC transporter ATP-binding protein [Candidatus Fermentibacter sp.]
MPDSAVTAVDLCKSFVDDSRGVIRAVDEVSFHVDRGEVLGILGVNGAGKTTTLRMLATLIEPTSGTASVDGHDVREDPKAARRSLGFLSSTTALYPRLTARETLRFFARMNGYPRERLEERVEKVVEMMSIGSYA